MTCFAFFDFGVSLLKISYLLQSKSFLVFTDRSKFVIFSNSTPIPSHLFLFPLEYILHIFKFCSNSITSVFIPVGVHSSYFQILLQFHHICFYSRWSTFSIFQISLQFHHICFYFRWSTFFIFQILLQFLRICFYSLWSIILIFQILLQITHPARITMRSYLLQIFHKSFLL